jgi:hypothetical protein
LKDSINQSRSERVVYSNLFRNIEGEMKREEEVYKGELLKARIAQ